MTLDRFKVFAAVAKHRNITRASEELHVSQPAVTKQLKLLEKDYNTKLFTRGGRGVELTERGKLFSKDVMPILKRCERLREKFGTGLSAVETLTVGGSYSPSVELLPSRLADFEKSHPHVRINLRTDNWATIEQMVLTSQVDIAVINKTASNPSLTIESYRHEPLVAFVSANHPLTRTEELTAPEFERIPVIIRKGRQGRGMTERLLRDMKTQGLEPNIVMRCDSPTAVKVAVKKQTGVGILYKETIEPELRRGEFKIIKLPVKKLDGRSFIVYRRDRPLSKNAQDFVDLLRRPRQKPTGRQTKAKLPQNLAKDI